MEVIEGAPPAEYGDKTSLVIVVDTRSGLGVTRPRRCLDDVWDFRHLIGIIRSFLRRQAMGEFHLA
jgi:hypothetical protein